MFHTSIKIALIIFLFICKTISVFPQKQIKSISNYDFLELDFSIPELTYIDDDFKIKKSLTESEFIELRKNAGFYSNVPLQFQDSLRILLYHDLQDSDKAYKTALQMGYSWLRLGYHMWLCEADAKHFALRYSLWHPYQMRSLLNHPEKWDAYMKQWVLTFRKKMFRSTNDSEVLTMPNELLFNYALRNSSDRIRDFELLKTGKIVSQKGCGKDNCCMLD